MTHKIITLCITFFLLTLGMNYLSANAEDKVIQEVELSSESNDFESYVSQNELGMLEVTLLTK